MNVPPVACITGQTSKLDPLDANGPAQSWGEVATVEFFQPLSTMASIPSSPLTHAGRGSREATTRLLASKEDKGRDPVERPRLPAPRPSIHALGQT